MLFTVALIILLSIAFKFFVTYLHYLTNSIMNFHLLLETKSFPIQTRQNGSHCWTKQTINGADAKYSIRLVLSDHMSHPLFLSYFNHFQYFFQWTLIWRKINRFFLPSEISELTKNISSDQFDSGVTTKWSTTRDRFPGWSVHLHYAPAE